MVAASHAAYFSHYSAMDWRAASPDDPGLGLHPPAGSQLTFEEVIVATGPHGLCAAAFAGLPLAGRLAAVPRLPAHMRAAQLPHGRSESCCETGQLACVSVGRAAAAVQLPGCQGACCTLQAQRLEDAWEQHRHQQLQQSMQRRSLASQTYHVWSQGGPSPAADVPVQPGHQPSDLLSPAPANRRPTIRPHRSRVLEPTHQAPPVHTQVGPLPAIVTKGSRSHLPAHPARSASATLVRQPDTEAPQPRSFSVMEGVFPAYRQLPSLLPQIKHRHVTRPLGYVSRRPVNLSPPPVEVY